MSNQKWLIPMLGVVGVALAAFVLWYLVQPKYGTKIDIASVSKAISDHFRQEHNHKISDEKIYYCSGLFDRDTVYYGHIRLGDRDDWSKPDQSYTLSSLYRDWKVQAVLDKDGKWHISSNIAMKTPSDVKKDNSPCSFL